MWPCLIYNIGKSVEAQLFFRIASVSEMLRGSSCSLLAHCTACCFHIAAWAALHPPLSAPSTALMSQLHTEPWGKNQPCYLQGVLQDFQRPARAPDQRHQDVQRSGELHNAFPSAAEVDHSLDGILRTRFYLTNAHFSTLETLASLRSLITCLVQITCNFPENIPLWHPPINFNDFDCNQVLLSATSCLTYSFTQQDKYLISKINQSTTRGSKGRICVGTPWEGKIWDAAVTMPSTGASDSDEWEHIRSQGLLPESGQVSYWASEIRGSSGLAQWCT